jgi:uncharacterized protein (TIGR03083 family)
MTAVTLRPAEPILVAHLFPRERSGLLDLLATLHDDDWSRPTVCEGWSVKDLVAHLLGDDLGRLSRDRDGYRDVDLAPGERLVDFINRRNEQWVDGLRRLSPRLLSELLAWTADVTARDFAAKDPHAMRGPVSWAGPDPAPVWLDIARELTERWHHGEQIRDAVGAPSADDPVVMGPVLATFAFSLPESLRGVDAPDGTHVVFVVQGDAGGAWTVGREDGAWRLYSGAAADAAATVTVAQDDAWRMYTRVLPAPEVERRARIEGDPGLAQRILSSVAIIA